MSNIGKFYLREALFGKCRYWNWEELAFYSDPRMASMFDDEFLAEQWLPVSHRYTTAAVEVCEVYRDI